MRILLLIAPLFSYFASQAQVMLQFKNDSVITWNYEDGDEFNGNKIKTSYWNYSYGWARSIYPNKEQQYYTDGANHILSNGSLKLVALKKDTTARMIDSYNDNDSLNLSGKFYGLNKTNFKYTSGMIQTKKTFLYGYYECRFKLPSPKGYWPAFWLYGGSPNEEIDIMEAKSERVSDIHIDTHCGDRCDYIRTFLKKESWGAWVKTNANFREDFNTISCEWTPDYIKFFLNGEFIGISPVNFRVPKNLVLNVAVPANDGPFHPGPDVKDTSRAIFEVDYVRVWSRNKPANLEKIKEQNPATDLKLQTNFSGKTFLKKKKKTHYGPKSGRENEGVFVSMFRNKNGLQIISSGKTKEETPEVLIYNENQILLDSKKINQTFVNIPLTVKGKIQVKVTYKGHSANAEFPEP